MYFRVSLFCDTFCCCIIKCLFSLEKENQPVSTGADPFGTLDPFGSGAFDGGGAAKVEFTSTQSIKVAYH